MIRAPEALALRPWKLGDNLFVPGCLFTCADCGARHSPENPVILHMVDSYDYEASAVMPWCKQCDEAFQIESDDLT